MGKSNVTTRKSQDGEEYKAREAPCEVDLNAIEFIEHDLSDWDAFPVYHFYVTAKEISDKKLPLWEANPREPTITTPVKNMLRTLEGKPEDFVKKNNGLTLIVDNIETFDNGERVGIEFGEKEGITNGGHTYFAIAQGDIPDSILENALVRVEAIEINQVKKENKSEIIKEISRARNAHKALKDASVYDQLEKYTHFKNWLEEEKMVEWRGGDYDTYENFIETKIFISILKSIDPSSYSHGVYNEDSDPHKRPATNSKGIFNDWGNQIVDNDNKTLEHLLPLINDIMSIRDKISYSLDHDPYLKGEASGKDRQVKNWSFYQDYILGHNKHRNLKYGRFDGETGINLNNRLEVLFTGLYRDNVWCGNRNNPDQSEYVGWFTEYDRLWDMQHLDVLYEMKDFYNNCGQEKEAFIRSKPAYRNPSSELFDWGTGQREKPPELVRDTSGNRYILVDNSETEIATHRLVCSENYNSDTRTVEMKKIENASDSVADYVKYSSLEYIGKDSLISEEDATHTVSHPIYGGIKKISDTSEYEHLYKIEK